MKKILLLLLTAATANGATITQTFSVPSQTTNWTQVWNANQFNPSLGALTKVTVEYTGTLAGTVRGESLNYSSSSYTYGLNGSVYVYKGATPLAGAIANLGYSDILFPFDGVIDFGGISGFSRNYSAPLYGFASFTSGLADFVGTGFLPLTWKAENAFAGSAGGNFIWNASSRANTDAKLVYTYATHAPEPATGLLLLGGLLAMWAVRVVEQKRRKIS